MKLSNYLEMEKAIDKPYVSYKEVMVLGMCGENRAREIMKQIIKREHDLGHFTYRERPMLVSTDVVLAAFNLSANKIRKEAESIRKSGISPL